MDIDSLVVDSNLSLSNSSNQLSISNETKITGKNV